ncbi:uncharacterized protein LOC143232598 [Tachypleus tridentatus]|uniref:uncharacterized protein LOC143232598 n=1 Tax=Tachypleus tridentatus TaxID=6853 RepID=UPI003FD5875D
MVNSRNMFLRIAFLLVHAMLGSCRIVPLLNPVLENNVLTDAPPSSNINNMMHRSSGRTISPLKSDDVQNILSEKHASPLSIDWPLRPRHQFSSEYYSTMSLLGYTKGKGAKAIKNPDHVGNVRNYLNAAVNISANPLPHVNNFKAPYKVTYGRYHRLSRSSDEEAVSVEDVISVFFKFASFLREISQQHMNIRNKGQHMEGSYEDQHMNSTYEDQRMDSMYKDQHMNSSYEDSGIRTRFIM